MIGSGGAHGDGAVASLVELLGPLGLDAGRAEELVRDLDRADAEAHEKQKRKDAVAADALAREQAAPVRRAAAMATLLRDVSDLYDRMAPTAVIGEHVDMTIVTTPRIDSLFAAAPPSRRPSPSHAQLDAFFATAEPTRRSSRGDKRPRVVDAPPPPKRRFQREIAVGDRVVWMKYGREGVVEAEVEPGVFRVLFDRGGFRETVRADELRVL